MRGRGGGRPARFDVPGGPLKWAGRLFRGALRAGAQRGGGRGARRSGGLGRGGGGRAERLERSAGAERGQTPTPSPGGVAPGRRWVGVGVRECAGAPLGGGMKGRRRPLPSPAPSRRALLPSPPPLQPPVGAEGPRSPAEAQSARRSGPSPGRLRSPRPSCRLPRAPAAPAPRAERPSLRVAIAGPAAAFRASLWAPPTRARTRGCERLPGLRTVGVDRGRGTSRGGWGALDSDESRPSGPLRLPGNGADPLPLRLGSATLLAA